MRVLFTSAAIPSHCHIQVPIALALRDAGHEVAFASGPNVVARLESVGIRAFRAGPPPEPTTLPPDDPRERNRWAWEQYFLGTAAAERLRDLHAICENWLPDMIVRESAEFAGCVEAESMRIPHAIIQNGNIAGLLTDWDRAWTWMKPRLDELRALRNLPPDPEGAMLYRYLLIVPLPRSFVDASVDLPATAHFVRPVVFDDSRELGLPHWVDALPPRPTVCVTLGQIHNARVDLFSTIIEALRDEPLNLVVTVGYDQNPRQFGPQPPNVRIERYVPLSLLLSRCDAMVNCGGMNSLRAAFEQAVPMVLLPLASDHPSNAARCDAMGLARVLDPRTMTRADVRDSVRNVLRDPTYRDTANQLRDEIRTMPGPQYAVELLEELCRSRKPLLATSSRGVNEGTASQWRSRFDCAT